MGSTCGIILLARVENHYCGNGLIPLQIPNEVVESIWFAPSPKTVAKKGPVRERKRCVEAYVERWRPPFCPIYNVTYCRVYRVLLRVPSLRHSFMHEVLRRETAFQVQGHYCSCEHKFPQKFFLYSWDEHSH